MQHQKSPEEIYKQQAGSYSELLKQLKRKRSTIGWLRLLIVLAIIFLVYYLFFNSSIFVWISVAAGIAVFLYVVSVDSDNNNNIAAAGRMLSINQEELAILDRNYYSREDGLSFLPDEHPYAGDIDLFGKASLYQYINRCTSEQSKKLLAFVLLNAGSKKEIIERQAAATALASHFEWRQKLQSTGMADPVTCTTEAKMMNWILMEKPLQHSFWKVLPVIFTTVTLASLTAYLVDWLPSSFFWLLVFCFFLIAKYTSGKVIRTYLALSRIENEINTIYEQLTLIEKVPAASRQIIPE